MVMTKKQTSAGVLYSFEIFGYQVYLMHTRRRCFRGGKKRSVTKRCLLVSGRVDSVVCANDTEEEKEWKGPCARTIEPDTAHLLYFKNLDGCSSGGNFRVKKKSMSRFICGRIKTLRKILSVSYS